ncbi:MAG: TatD family deoxyribonuclease [Proteobacteria bacterium]|nr:TatD family deoxyribonuclease [Pseudomonadota bacterium]
MLIDTHCHLNYEYDGGKTPDQLVAEAKANEVGILITIATEEANFKTVQEYSERFPTVYHTIGVHPHEASLVNPAVLDSMRRFLSHPKCVAVGEIGLDYYYEHSEREKQRTECRSQLELAIETKKPVVIHSRDGEDDLLPMLTDYAKRQSGAASLGVIHCFTGTETFGRACLDLGFFISISGILTFKNSETLRQTVKAFPLDRLLVETDSPFLAPAPLRGKKCEPFMVKHTALKLAEVMGVSYETLAQVTTANAKKCFGII